MTRARFVMGDDAMKQRFEGIKRAVISARRDAEMLKNEIVGMRHKVRAAHPVKVGWFDVKHSPGGMVDAEFVVQYLILLHANAHPSLSDNVGNIALLQRAEKLGLLPVGVGQAAASAYRVLRHVQHKARLNEEPTQVQEPSLNAEQSAIRVLWEAVF
jgi:glutamate-ammonia-ligase adenylyltransferase